MKTINNIGIFILTLLFAACSSSDNNKEKDDGENGDKTELPVESGDIRPAVKTLEFFSFEGSQQISVESKGIWRVSAIYDCDGKVMAEAENSQCNYDWLTASRTSDGDLLVTVTADENGFDSYLVIALVAGNDLCLIEVKKKEHDDMLNDDGEVMDGSTGDGGEACFTTENIYFEPQGGTVVVSVLDYFWAFEYEGKYGEDSEVYTSYWITYRKIGLNHLMITAEANDTSTSRSIWVWTDAWTSKFVINVYQKQPNSNQR